MPKTRIIFFWMLALLLSSLACRAATRLIIPDTPTVPPPPTLTPLPPPTETAIPTITATVEVNASCPLLLDDIMDASISFGETEDAREERFLVTYSVNGDEIDNPQYETVPVDLKDEQKDVDAQKSIWNFFTSIIPQEQRSLIAEYAIMTDGKDNILAAVSQTYDNPALWALEVDIKDSDDYYSLTFTLVHEFGHLLTLNPGQVPPDLEIFNHPNDDTIYQEAVDACPRYFPGEGCSAPDSYINAFFQSFWPKIYDEWLQIDGIEDEDTYYQKLNEFYDKYQDQFLTDYAVTNPAEDIAESWSFFILSPKPEGNTIAEEKILFFYDYPELVDLRQEILNRLCISFPQ